MKNWKQADHIEVWPDSTKEKNWCVSVCDRQGHELWCHSLWNAKAKAVFAAKTLGAKSTLSIRIYCVHDAPAACN